MRREKRLTHGLYIDGRSEFFQVRDPTRADFGINRHFLKYDVMRRQGAWGEGWCSKIFNSGSGVQAKKIRTHGLYIAEEEVEVVLSLIA